MSTSLVLPEGVPEGARQLGIRNAPSLRLSIGFRNPQRGNAPDKLDYFRAKEGASGEFAAAARKFHEVYGPTPKAIDISLAASLEDTMRIEYLAFKGSKDDPLGGVMVARGKTNFATLGYAGGPDTLTVWDEDGTVREVQTKGMDGVTRAALDQTAHDLGLMLCTTFCVGLPKVLGFGSHAEITSKSLRSTDQIWKKLTGWYIDFPNGTIRWAMHPMLVVKPAQGRPVIKTKDGKVGRKRVLIYVLDVVDPETQDDHIAALEKYRGAVALTTSEPRAAIAELEAGDEPSSVSSPSSEEAKTEEGTVEDITDAEIVNENSGPDPSPGTPPLSPEPGPEQPLDGTAGEPDPGHPHPSPGTGSAGAVELDAIPRPASEEANQPPEGFSAPPGAGDVSEEPVLGDPPPAPADGPSEDELSAARAAGRMKPPVGTYQNRTLDWIVQQKNGQLWLEYAIGESVKGSWSKDAKFERALWAFVKVHLPDVYAANAEHAR